MMLMAIEPNENDENNEKEEEKLRKVLAKRYKALQIEEQKKQIIRRFLEPEAYERLMNVRIANYELYQQLLDLLIALIQSKKITKALSDSEFKQLLAQLTSRPSGSIQIMHK